MFEATFWNGQDTSGDEEMSSEASSTKKKSGKAKRKTTRASSPRSSEEEEDASKVVYQESGESDVESVVYSNEDLSPSVSPQRQAPQAGP